LYAEFIEWVKFLILGIGGVLLAFIMWRSEGFMGKAIVIVTVVFIIAEAIVKTHKKYLADKIKQQKDKIILERMEKHIVKLHDNLGEMAIRFQKHLDDFEGEAK
jgi:hypothetical protein